MEIVTLILGVSILSILIGFVLIGSHMIAEASGANNNNEFDSLMDGATVSFGLAVILIIIGLVIVVFSC